MLFGDLGAEIIKIEDPNKGDMARNNGPFVKGVSSYFLSVNRGKKSITLNLRNDAAKEIIRRLIRRSDILVENFRPGVMKAMGFDYENARELNPGIIYLSVSGFGQSGPYAQKPAFDMVAQGMGGSIINLSSKSGLDASKNNTAYNATKAGELHMARGWALELGEHGIRVNSIAPGNVFEGSKIWNPDYIKVCAKKNGIRPEEVIPFYVNKTALRREIKGQDIADAVVFLCSDRARTITGQTLVADSGQVMVR